MGKKQGPRRKKMINSQQRFQNKSYQRNLVSCYNREIGLMRKEEGTDIHYSYVNTMVFLVNNLGTSVLDKTLRNWLENS